MSMREAPPSRRRIKISRFQSLLALTLMLSALTCSTHAQTPSPKKQVTSDADLPRISYPVTGSASDLLLSTDPVFEAFARKVAADNDAILANYAIADKSTLRRLLGTKANAQILTGDPKGALETLGRIRDLEEKPEAKITSGLINRAVLKAWIATGAHTGPDFDKAFAQDFKTAVDALPWASTQETVKQIKASYQIVSESLVVGDLKESTDPQVLKSGTIDFAPASAMLRTRNLLKLQLPLRAQIEAAVTPYIAAHNIQKPDIWAAREVTLNETEKLTPVRIGIWDSGVDTALYPNQLFTDPNPGEHSSHGLAYDVHGKLFNGDLQPLSADQAKVYPSVLDREQGIDDLQNGIESPAAAETQKYFSSTPPDQIAPFFKQMSFLGQYMHGTHVAGIAVRGNPAARLVVLQFYDSLPEIPFAPTAEWANQFKADFQQLGDYVREHDVRVVNMSWGDSQGEIEQWLTKTSSEKDPEVRKKFAAQIYRIWKEAVEGAIQAAPKTLFVCAAGNSDANPAFLGDVPASLHFPNLISVGAVDQSGGETSFSSHGDTVVLDADGFRVDSLVPGGKHMKFSGTSMASPNVVNLAAKLFALDPSLTPEQVIALMEKGADTSLDGRRHLLNPKATVALLDKPAK